MVLTKRRKKNSNWVLFFRFENYFCVEHWAHVTDQSLVQNFILFEQCAWFDKFVVCIKIYKKLCFKKIWNKFFLSSGFCAFNFWIKKLNSNRVNLLSKLYSELDVFFDYDVWSRKLKQTMRHIMRQWDIYFNVKTMRYIMRQWDNETYYILVCMW